MRFKMSYSKIYPQNTFTLFFRLTTFVVAQFIAPLTFMVCLKFTHEPKRPNNYGFHYKTSVMVVYLSDSV